MLYEVITPAVFHSVEMNQGYPLLKFFKQVFCVKSIQKKMPHVHTDGQVKFRNQRPGLLQRVIQSFHSQQARGNTGFQQPVDIV